MPKTKKIMNPEKEPKEKIDLELARKHFDEWNNSLQFKNTEDSSNHAVIKQRASEVASHYAEDNVIFLATVRPEVRKNRNEAQDYFQHFLESHPSGSIVEGSDKIIVLSDNCYVHHGLYEFTLNPGTENEKKVLAQFAFVRKKINGEWKIIGHFSAPMEGTHGINNLKFQEDAGKRQLTADSAPDGEAVLKIFEKHGKQQRKLLGTTGEYEFVGGNYTYTDEAGNKTDMKVMYIVGPRPSGSEENGTERSIITYLSAPMPGGRVSQHE